ncbi:MAG: indole-3-glycerol phosphate synthase TrpC [Pseudomonadota bacterium]
MTATILDKIKAYKLEEIAARKAEVTLEDMQDRAKDAPHVRDFAGRLTQATKTGYGLIAEIKKASPSKGVIREDFDPKSLAEAYAAGGATCLSVLTDGPSFQGSEEALIAARAACDLPVIRKDFLYDPYQVYEARAMGADCILIIMAALEDAQAHALEDTAEDLGMSVLLEVHNEEELKRATALRSPLLGINNRDLNTFETSLDTTRMLSRLAPEDRLLISESGLFTPEDLADMAMYGARAFLIGESLMRQEDVTVATRQLLNTQVSSAGVGM